MHGHSLALLADDHKPKSGSRPGAPGTRPRYGPRMRWQTKAGALVVALGTTGCVTQGQYDGTLRELGDARSAASEAQEALAQCQQELAAARTGAPPDDAEREALEQELAQLRAANAERQAAFEQLKASLAEMIAAGELEVYVRRGRLIIGLPSGVLFASGKADLSKGGKRTVKKVAGVLKGLSGRRIEVAGHTDNVPIGAKLDFEDNWELSTLRALTVTRFLVTEGVDPINLSAAGYSEFDPVKSNAAPAGRRKNRRIELVLVPDLSALPELMEDGGGAQ